MKTTNTKSSLDDHKLKYELTDGDPKRPKPSAIRYSDLKRAEKQVKRASKPKRFNPVKAYFSYMLEVVLK